MSGVADGIVEFLRARLDEDEAAAKAAGGDHWHYPSHESSREDMLSDSGEIVMYRDSLRDDMGLHIARHDPARVLADVEAKRRIVEDFEHYHSEYRKAPSPFAEGRRLGALLAVSRLAEAYDGHPDWREEWRA